MSISSSLSRAQEAVWCQSYAYSPESRPHSGRVYELVGDLDTAALERAVALLAQRHEGLRTVFSTSQGRPRAVVRPHPTVALQVEEGLAGARSRREAEARELCQRIATDRFDFWEEPAWRVSLLRVDRRTHLLVLVAHEIVCDAWAFDVLVDELSELYGACRDDRPPALPDPGAQPRDVAADERAWLASPRADSAAEYWSEAMAGAPLTLELPFEPRADTRGPHGPGQARRPLPGPVARALQAAGQQQRATPFMVYLAAFYAVLHFRTGDTDLVVGSPTANRTRRAYERVVTVLMCTLPLRARLSPAMTFRELIDQVRDVVIGGISNAGVAPTQEELLLAAGLPRGLWTRPVRFRLSRSATSPALGTDLSLAGIRSRLLASPGPAGDLMMDVVAPPGESSSLCLHYDRALLDDGSARAILEEYARTLGAAHRDPNAEISSLGDGARTPSRRKRVRFRGFDLTRRLEALERDLQSHALVRDAAVAWDEASHSLDAYVSLRARVTTRTLTEWVRRHADAIVPSRYLVVGSIPRGDDGTLDLEALRGVELDRLTSGPADKAEVQMQARLAAIWRDILRVSTVEASTNFFASGGTFAAGAAMVAAARDRGIAIGTRDLLAGPTVGELAAAACRAREAQAEPATLRAQVKSGARGGPSRKIVVTRRRDA